MTTASLTPVEPVSSKPRKRSIVEWSGWFLLMVLVVLLVPLYLQMPLTADTNFYDLAARHVLRGGALERDLLFLPPPGMAWTIAAVRWLFGFSTLALRLADLSIVGLLIVLILDLLSASRVPRPVLAWTAAALAAFYLTTSEWVHGQPDSWMLLPALAAVRLRLRQLGRGEQGEASPRTTVFPAVAEGLLWGSACLFKPHVALPALAVWLSSALWMWRSRTGCLPTLLADAAGLLMGGLAMLALWQGWLWHNGTWDAYWQNVKIYRGEYYSQDASVSVRLFRLFLGNLFPWGLFQLLAIPLACSVLFRFLRRLQGTLAIVLLAAFSLAWTGQANFIQNQFGYQLAPSLLLVITFLVATLGAQPRLPGSWVALFALFSLATVSQAALRPERLAQWKQCWTQPSSPVLWNALALDRAPQAPDWEQLQQVADYLREQGVQGKDVLCYDLSTTHLYPILNTMPSTRFLYPGLYQIIFQSLCDQLGEEMEQGPQRFVVTDMREVKSLMDPRAERPGQPLALPPDFPENLGNRYPYRERIVFRAGRFLVHEVQSRSP